MMFLRQTHQSSDCYNAGELTGFYSYYTTEAHVILWGEIMDYLWDHTGVNKKLTGS